MKVITAQPMTMEEIVRLTGRDALYNIDGDPVRIMNASPDQIIDVDKVICSDGKVWGLRRTPNNKKYSFIAMLIDKVVTN